MTAGGVGSGDWLGKSDTAELHMEVAEDLRRLTQRWRRSLVAGTLEIMPTWAKDVIEL